MFLCICKHLCYGFPPTARLGLICYCHEADVPCYSLRFDPKSRRICLKVDPPMAFFIGMRYRSSQQDRQSSETITKDVQHLRKRRRRMARLHFATLVVIILVVMLLGFVSFVFVSSRNDARENPAALGIWSVGSHSMRRTKSRRSKRDEDKQAGSLQDASSSLDCIPSPLVEREATPEYGCEEMEVRVDMTSANKSTCEPLL